MQVTKVEVSTAETMGEKVPASKKLKVLEEEHQAIVKERNEEVSHNWKRMFNLH